MTASAARRPSAVYVSQVTMYPVTPGDPDTDHVVISTPRPIHHARIHHYPKTLRWRVWMTSVNVPRTLEVDSFEVATATAAEWVSRLAGRDLQRFSAPQRIALGQQQCPRLKWGGLCLQAAGMGTVWCDDHPNGVRREA